MREIILQFGWGKGLGQNGAENDIDQLSDVKNMVYSGQQIKRREGTMLLGDKSRVSNFLFFKELDIVGCKLLCFISAYDLSLKCYTALFPEVEYTLYRSDYQKTIPVSFMSDFRDIERQDPVLTTRSYSHIETTQSHFIISSNGKILEILKNGSIEYDHTNKRIYIDVRDATNYPPVRSVNFLSAETNAKPIQGRVRVGEMNERGIISELSEPLSSLDKAQGYFTRTDGAAPKKILREDGNYDLEYSGINTIYYYDNGTPTFYTTNESVLDDNLGAHDGQQLDTPDLTELKPTLNAVQGTKTFQLFPQPGSDQYEAQYAGKGLLFIAFQLTASPQRGTESPNPSYYGFLWTPYSEGEEDQNPNAGFTLLPETYAISRNIVYKYNQEPDSAGTVFISDGLGGTSAFLHPIDLASDSAVGRLTENAIPDPFCVVKVLDDSPIGVVIPTKIKPTTNAFMVIDGTDAVAVTAQPIESPVLESMLKDCMSVKVLVGGQIRYARFACAIIHVTDPEDNDPANGFPSTNPYFTTNISFASALINSTPVLRAKNRCFNVWEILQPITEAQPLYLDAIKGVCYQPNEVDFDVLMSLDSYLSQVHRPFAVVKDDKQLAGYSQVFYYNNDFSKVPEYVLESHKRAYFPVIATDFQKFLPSVGDLDTKAVLAGMGVTAAAYTTGKMVIATQTQLLDTDVNFMIKGVIEGAPGNVKFLFPINKYIVGVTENKIFAVDANNSISLIQTIDRPIASTPALGGQIVITETLALFVFPEFVEDRVVVRTQDLKAGFIPDVIFEHNSKVAGNFEKFYVGSGSDIYEFSKGRWTRHGVLTDQYFVEAMAMHNESLVVAMMDREFDRSVLYPSNIIIAPE